MDRRHPIPPGGQHSRSSNDPNTHRRARSYSQPLASPAIPGPSSQRPPEPFDFLDSQLQAGPSRIASSISQPEFDFDEDTILRSMLAEGHQQSLQAQLDSFPPFAPNVQHMPPPALPPMQPLAAHPQMTANPLLSHTFAAWLQYMQLQVQLQQQNQAAQQGPLTQQPQAANPPQHQHQPHSQPIHSPVSRQLRPLLPHAPFQPVSPQSPQSQAGGSSLPAHTPSPEAGDNEFEGQSITEEKRRRNTAASARFRVKKKMWTQNLERSITELSNRVEELEREASELRRENGWLKEIVMLKSKRFGASGSDANLTPPDNREAPSTPPSSSTAEEGSGETKSDDEADCPGKGKEVQR